MSTTAKSPAQSVDRKLAQTLAVQSQIHLPGTVGRVLKQIRDIEAVAPIFSAAGLVRKVDRPNPLDVRVAGIATDYKTRRILGGAIYIAAATRIDLNIAQNVVATAGQDNLTEIDDINYENQDKRLQLIAIRQAYHMAEAALRSPERYDLILLDCPLVLNRSMVPLREDESYASLRRAYQEAVQTIADFWLTRRESLFPWNPAGPVVAGLASERYGAIVHIAQQDLRTAEGRSQVLASEQVNAERMSELARSPEAIVGIGERRFVYGILGEYTRTAAFRLNAHTPEMEPREITKIGVIGLHYKAAQNTTPTLLQLVGDEPEWTREHLDRVVGQLMALTVLGGSKAAPLPIQLAMREQKALGQFIDYYGRSVEYEIKRKDSNVEAMWMSGLDEL
jgi:hypothetical protein